MKALSILPIAAIVLAGCSETDSSHMPLTETPQTFTMNGLTFVAYNGYPVVMDGSPEEFAELADGAVRASWIDRDAVLAITFASSRMTCGSTPASLTEPEPGILHLEFSDADTTEYCDDMNRPVTIEFSVETLSDELEKVKVEFSHNDESEIDMSSE